MRQALLSNRGQQSAGVAQGRPLAAPVQGWNTRDPLAQMRPLYAAILDNWYPTTGEVVMRGGSESWATGGSGAVRTLVSFDNKDGTQELFACTDAGIYDATAGGAMGATVTTLTDGRLETVIVTNSAGTTYLWGVNGADKVKVYDGTTWANLDNASTPAITGPTVQSLSFPWLYKRRIMVVEKDSMNFWFGPIDSIAGRFSKFSLGALFKRGGRLLAGATWTMDGGQGPDDYCVFITSAGELAVYNGINPASATSWSLVGVYYVGRPPSRRCFAQYGGDLIAITEFGLVSLSQLLSAKLLDENRALSSNIRPSFNAAVRAYAANDGWQVMLFPAQNALLVNIPLDTSTVYQFVMNTTTGAWCSFSGWTANHFVVHNGQLYYGLAGGIVAKAWDGVITGDFGNDIVATSMQAYSRPRQTRMTQTVLVAPLLTTNNATQLGMGFSADFDEPTITSVIPRSATQQATSWTAAIWNVSLWSGRPVRQKRWYHVSSEPGFAQAFILQAKTKDATLVAWSGTNTMVQP